MSSSSTTTSPPFPVPDGFKLHTENNAHILMSENEAFLNPVQEFNRDLSVACIRTWSEELNKAKDAKRAQARQKRASRAKEELAKKRQRGKVQLQNHYPRSTFCNWTSFNPLCKRDTAGKVRTPSVRNFARYVLANDLSSTAVAAMKRNVELNGLGPSKELEETGSAKQANTHLGKVRVNEGDACHRTDRVDVVDLDPYGTAAPFIDAAVQAVKDEGEYLTFVASMITT
ncbi:hypothetical protein HHX47_DHR1000749 [Lentinula edodes]|nr:hypothetical protein HHX47_DHR1000749 [Lentinula edodes]